MEPPAKRARLGHVPHDDERPLKLSKPSKRGGHDNGSAAYGTAHGGNGNDSGDGGVGEDEDEIAMDPEDYAMKQNPEYRLEKSRAVADNRLKSAFELLFDKYSKDFGDTGDEINFYTDEIEVDNGHIASLPVAKEPPPQPSRPRHQTARFADGDEDETEVDTDEAQYRYGHAGRSSASYMAASLLAARPPAGVGVAADSVDPMWAPPELPENVFSTPRGGPVGIRPPRIVYSVPHRTIFRKFLPKMYGRLRADENDDDLIRDISEPILNFRDSESTPRRVATLSFRHSSARKVLDASARSTASPKPQSAARRKSQTPAKTAQTMTKTPQKNNGEQRKSETKTGVRTFVPDSQSSEPLHSSLSSRRASSPFVPEESPPRTTLVFALIGSPSPVVGSLPMPPEENRVRSDGVAGEEALPPVGAASGTPAETFTRNTYDPSFAFSDEEDFGLKRRKKPLTVSGTSPTAGTNGTEIKKRGRGRPRKHPINSEAGAAKEKAKMVTGKLANPKPIRKDATTTTPSTKHKTLPSPKPATEEPATSQTANSAPAKRRGRPRTRPQPDPETVASSEAKDARREIPDSQGFSSSMASLVSDNEDDAHGRKGDGARPPPPADANSRAAATPQKQPGSAHEVINMSRLRTPLAAHRILQVRSASVNRVASTLFREAAGQRREWQRSTSVPFSSPLAASVAAHLRQVAPSPSGPLVQTPGGTLRRCGQDGFRCEREFCFKCG